jgi:V8-like Glu-specific endopeptidase
MKSFSILMLIMSFFISTNSIAVVYGNTDDRHEVYETSSAVQVLSKSVAIRILKTYMDYKGNMNGVFKVGGVELGKEHCSSVRFAEQILGGPHVCTGFLVKDDLLVTAGHCYRDIVADCNDYAWVFDYALKGAGDRTYVNVLGQNIYTCKKVVRQRFEEFGAVDYTVVQLDRKVTDRLPLGIDLTSTLEKGLPVFTIGYPSGLPAKVAGNSTIIENPDQKKFITDTDAFQGNSGSPVFDEKTGKVIGIVSGGQNDYVRNGSCKVVKICRIEDKCVMSSMSRISNILTDSVLKGILYP